jgi:hypothetical protein
MTDKEILDYCKGVLKKNSYISVAWQLKHSLKLNPDEALIRRIRAKLLELPEYVESSEKEKEGGYLRIRKRGISKKEKFPLAYDLIIGSAGGVIVAIATYFLTPATTNRLDQQQLQRLDSTISSVNRRVDSIKIIQSFEDTAKHN